MKIAGAHWAVFLVIMLVATTAAIVAGDYIITKRQTTVPTGA